MNQGLLLLAHSSVQFSSVAQSRLTLCNPVDCSMPGFPLHHHLLEFTQTHVHWVGDAMQPSHPLLSPSPPAFNLSQHQGLFKWVSSSHQVAKVLEFQLQYQSFQDVYIFLQLCFSKDTLEIWLQWKYWKFRNLCCKLGLFPSEGQLLKYVPKHTAYYHQPPQDIHFYHQSNYFMLFQINPLATALNFNYYLLIFPIVNFIRMESYRMFTLVSGFFI